ncbi:E3 ubiquitin-protein ligase PDZRN3-B, partial [Araneus ventricosus]
HFLPMAPPIWAYQVDNFDPPPDEELICSVCRSVFCDPVQSPICSVCRSVFCDPVQSPCNHVFCRSCINKWLESNRNCPICRKRTTKYTVQEVVPIVKNMIMKLILYCHNKEKGCEEKFPLESCEAHLKVCVYEIVRCNNKPCKEMLMRKDLEDHELNKCLHRYIRCQNCCLKISSIGPAKHNCVKALKKRLRDMERNVTCLEVTAVLQIKRKVHIVVNPSPSKQKRGGDNDRDLETSSCTPSLLHSSSGATTGEAGQSFSGRATDVQETAAQGSVENGHMPSSSIAGCSHDGAQVSNSNIPFKLRPRVMRSNTEQATAAPLPPARRNSRGIFERTRALLEQYSLESDPEWLPPNPMDAEDVQSDSDSSFHPPVYPDDRFSTSSDSSSSDDDSSSDSSYVDAQSRTNMLCGFNSFRFNGLQHLLPRFMWSLWYPLTSFLLESPRTAMREHLFWVLLDVFNE